VLQSALELFVGQGYHGTSMRQLALASGLTPASLYNHFDSKEVLFRQVLLRYHPYRDMIANLEMVEGETPEELVKDAARRIVAIVRSRRDLQHLMFIEMVEFNGAHAAELFSQAYPTIQKFLGKLMKDQQALRPIAPANLMFTFMGVMMSQWILEGLFHQIKELSIQPDHFETSVDIFLHGILSQTELKS
jgi:AcrR family transcriptional regulator